MRGQVYGLGSGRARHLLVLAAAGLALVALVVVVIGLVTGEDSGQNSGQSAGQNSGRGDDMSTTSTITPTDGPGGSAGLSEQVGEDAGEWGSDPDTGLPIGATSRDGHPVRFPRTEVGAAAMVVELNRAQIGLDYDAALTTIRVYAAPSDQAFFDELATSAVALRRKNLGVPAQLSDGGEVNAPAGYAQTPIGYQLEEYGPDYYLVSVLNEVSTTTSDGRVTRSDYVGQQFVSWTPETEGEGVTAGDWQLVEPRETDREQLLAAALPAVAPLDSPKFEQAGWTPLLDPSTSNTGTGTGTGSSSDNDSGAAGSSADNGLQ